MATESVSLAEAHATPIVVFSKQMCPQCNMTKRHLTSKLGEPAADTWAVVEIDHPETGEEAFSYVKTHCADIKSAPVVIIRNVPQEDIEDYLSAAPNAIQQFSNDSGNGSVTLYFGGFVPAVLNVAAEKNNAK